MQIDIHFNGVKNDKCNIQTLDAWMLLAEETLPASKRREST